MTSKHQLLNCAHLWARWHSHNLATAIELNYHWVTLQIHPPWTVPQVGPRITAKKSGETVNLHTA